MKRVVAMMVISLLATAAMVGASEGEDGMSNVNNGRRTLYHEIVVSAPLEDVWAAWTTTEGVNSFFTPNADVELRVGGKYEMYFDMAAEPGVRGAEGCHVLSFLPMTMLSYEWNAPPSIPNLRNAGVQTWVVMEFEPLEDNRVRIKHTMLGIGEGEDWDKYVAYFDRAWTNVLDACKQRFERGPVDWSATK